LIVLALLLAAAGEYVIQPGDTCVKVAQKVYGDPKSIDRIHQLNELGNPPHHLIPGKRLRIEIDADARLTYVKPDVNHKKAGGADWGPAAQGEDLFRLDQVNTLKGAGAEVTFRDQSALQIRESALVVINGRGAGPGSTETKSGAVSLVQGELRLKLAQMRGEKPIAVSTPAGKVAARGGDLALGVDAQKMSRISVLEGSAEVSASGKSVNVPGGSGTRVANGKAPEKPRPLPAAPQWATRELLFLGTRPAADSTRAAGSVGAVLEWTQVPRAARYLLLVARDERFLDVAAQAEVPAAHAAVALPPGRYLARVQAFDDAGLQGPPSEVRQVVIALALLDSAPGEVKGKLEGPVEWQLDSAPVKDAFTLFAPGDHVLTVRAPPDPRYALPGTAVEEKTTRFETKPPPIEAELVPRKTDFLLRISLPPGLPVEPLTFETASQVTAIERLPDGTVHGLVSAPEGSRKASLVLLWAGQRVGQAAAELPAPPPPPPPPAPEPRVSDDSLVGEPIALEADALPVVRPALRNGVRARLQLADLTTFDPRFTTAIDLRAGAHALASISYTSSAQQGTLSSFTARVQALDAARFFSAGVALTVPTLGAESVRARVHAGKGVELGQLELSSTQALGVGLGHGARVAWDSGYTALLRLRPWLAAGLEVDAIVGQVPHLGTVIAPVGAAGLRFRKGPFEAGLSARLALGSDADAVWSRSALLFSFGMDAGPP
jgi:hypothetical protein